MNRVIFDIDGVLLWQGHPTPLLKVAKELQLADTDVILVSGREERERLRTINQLGGLWGYSLYLAGDKFAKMVWLASEGVLTIFENDPVMVQKLWSAGLPCTPINSDLYRRDNG